MPPEAASGLRLGAMLHRGLLVPVLIVALVLVIVVPVPAALLDLLLTASIALSVLILLTTLYVARPLDFSVFPSILLGATLIRLVLNFASTRLILSRAATDGTRAAGGVIETFGDFVAGGQVAVGLILFVILVVVQVLVITRGSTRISEVAARFALDAMPGRQMAIDSDLTAGLISPDQAQQRRDELAGQADFYAAMDGAGKFVRGDAIAGIVITLANIVGGLYVGLVIHGMSIDRAVDVFTRLTIGDGLVTQVPALLISMAAGLIVTRSSGSSNLPREVMTQLFGHSEALFLAAAFLAVLTLTGLPPLPLLALAGTCAVIGFVLRTNRGATTALEPNSHAHSQPADHRPPARPDPFAAPLELQLGAALVPLANGNDLLDRIARLRREVAADLGTLLPDVLVRDNLSMSPESFEVRLRDVPVARGEVVPGGWLAIDVTAAGGVPAEPAGRDPVTGRPAKWIGDTDRPAAEAAGWLVLDPATVVLRQLDQVVREHAAELLSRQQVHQLLDRLAERAPRLVAELVPDVVTPICLRQVLGNLLEEDVPIRDLETILETLGEQAGETTDGDRLTEFVRAKLGRVLCRRHADPDGRLRVLTLDPELEERIEEASRFSGSGLVTWLDPELARRIEVELAERSSDGKTPPIVLCSSPLVRAALKQVTRSQLPALVALSLEELPPGIPVESLGQLQIADSGQLLAA